MKIVNLFKLLIYIPINLIGICVPKSENIWVFGAWFGERFDDNPRAIFDYINQEKKEIQAIWITRSDEVYSYLNLQGLNVYKQDSFLGIYYCLRANVGVVCTSFADLNRNLWIRSVVNTWHGTPLKVILHDASDMHETTVLRRLFKRIIPRFRSLHDYSLVMSASQEESAILTGAFKIDPTKFAVVGHARNDFLLGHKTLCDNDKIKVLYMPTHRSEGNSEFLEEIMNDFRNRENDFYELGVEVTVKAHFYHKLISEDEQISCLKIFNETIEKALYSQVKDYDILITDFSSIMFDWSLLKKPILFYAPDYDDYIQHERKLYFDYNDITSQNYSKDIDHLIQNLKKELYNSSELSDLLQNIFEHKDGQNSKRNYEAIMDRLL